MATRDNLPQPNCDSDSRAENKQQRMVVWQIYHQSECQEEVIFVNFPCTSENISCQWASVDTSWAHVTLHFIYTTPHNSWQTCERGCPSHSLLLCYISMNRMLEHRKAINPRHALWSPYSLYTWVKRYNVIHLRLKFLVQCNQLDGDDGAETRDQVT